MSATDAPAVRPLLARLLGHDPGSMVYQPYGHANRVYRLPEHNLVVKISTNLAAFDHTIGNLRILQGLDIPVPTVVARGDDGVRAALVLEWIPGRDLGHALSGMATRAKRLLATQLAEIQARATALPLGAGFGWTPLGAKGEFPTWLAVVGRDHGNLSPRFRDQIDLAPWRGVLRGIRPVPFLDDVTVKNVIVHEGRLRGIVDLDSVCYGDPLYWLALAETTAVLDCNDWDYGRLLRDAWAPTPMGERLTDLYGAIFAAGFLDRAPNERMRLFFERRIVSARHEWGQRPLRRYD